MINNKQVSLWRGSDPPPTIYHVWILDNLILKIYNGTEWVVFSDEITLIQRINELVDRVTDLELFMNNSTINGFNIKDNPVLNATNLKTASSGVFIDENENVSDTLKKLDKLLDIEIIE